MALRLGSSSYEMRELEEVALFLSFGLTAPAPSRLLVQMNRAGRGERRDAWL